MLEFNPGVLGRELPIGLGDTCSSAGKDYRDGSVRTLQKVWCDYGLWPNRGSVRLTVGQK
jgi:hypothetical protein